MATNHENNCDKQTPSSCSRQSSGKLSSNDIDNESIDEEYDNIFDKKLDYINIIKINTDYLMKGKTIRYVKDFRVAEGIIKTITCPRSRRKSLSGIKLKSLNSLDGQNVESARIDKEIATDASISEHKHPNGNIEITTIAKSTAGLESNQNVTDESCTKSDKDTFPKVERLLLKKEVLRMIERRAIDFKLHLYLVENKKSSHFSKVFSEMVTEESRKRFPQGKEITRSYLIFFFRNLDENEKRPITPEIYALTTGSAGQLVARFADKNFVSKIEGRVLQFPYKKISYQNIGGPVSREEKLARTGNEILLSAWDYLDVLVKSRTRQIRENSSLYLLPHGIFLSKKGKHVPTKFQLSESKLKIQRQLSLSQFGVLLKHFSEIFSNKITYEAVGDKVKEEDDKRFKTYDFFSKVTDKELVSNLNNSLYKVLKDSMDGTKSKIYLTQESFEKWKGAVNIKLQAKKTKSAAGKQIKPRFQTLKTFNDFPSLDAVVTTLKETYPPESPEDVKPEYFDNVIVKIGSKKVPLTKCIFSRFNIEGSIGTYLYNHGNWLEVRAEYLCLMEADFVQMLSPHLLNSDEISVLLPWKYQGDEVKEKKQKQSMGAEEKTVTKCFQLQPFDVNKMKPKWEKHFQKLCKGKNFDNILIQIKALFDKNEGIACDFQQLKGMSLDARTAYLYTFLECKLNEDSFNSAHTLLNMILPDGSDKIITCDKKLANGLELCDILIFNETKTYLVHVKAEFGQPIRDLCSQVRNAAENIYRELTISNGTGIIDEYWKVLTKPANNPKSHENEVKEILENLTEKKFKELFTKEREIVFVLACRDARTNSDFSKDIHISSDDHIADIIKEKLPQSSEIVNSLKENNFLTNEGSLTDTFILEGKNRKTKFIGTIKQWESVGSEKKANEVFEIMMSGLSRSKSTVAKMEMIRLMQDFKRYYVGEYKLQLKVVSIEK